MYKLQQEKPTLTFFRQAFLDLWFVAKVYYCTQYIYTAHTRQWMVSTYMFMYVRTKRSIVLHYMNCPTDFVHSADKNVYCFAKW